MENDSCLCVFLHFCRTPSAQMLSDFLNVVRKMWVPYSAWRISYCTASFANLGIYSPPTANCYGIPVILMNILFKVWIANSDTVSSETIRGHQRKTVGSFTVSYMIYWIRSEFQKWFHSIHDFVPKDLNQLFNFSHIKSLASRRQLGFPTLHVRFPCNQRVVLEWKAFFCSQAEQFANKWRALAHRLFG